VLIQQIEEALTRLQEKKAKLIETKHKYESTQHTNEAADITAFVEALGGTIENIWHNESIQNETDVGGTQNGAPSKEG
jgi:hypothetical protein